MIHERKPNRMKGYDYSKDNLYFVTICVHNRICCFGEIVGTGRDLSKNKNDDQLTIRTGHDLSKHNDPSKHHDPSLQPLRNQMILNEYGQIAEKQWYWLSEQYPYIVLHAFVVMPNHVHGIIEINRTAAAVGTGRDLSKNKNDDQLTVRTGRDLSSHRDLSNNKNDDQLTVRTGRDLSIHRDLSTPKIKSLSEILGAYKTTISKQIHLLGYIDFEWQRSFHDHIIRDDQSYINISNYILTNPDKWETDKFYNPGI